VQHRMAPSAVGGDSNRIGSSSGSSSRLNAINSRELRFYSSGQTHSREAVKNARQHSAEISLAASIPEVLASSMAFLANYSSGASVKLGSLLGGSDESRHSFGTIFQTKSSTLVTSTGTGTGTMASQTLLQTQPYVRARGTLAGGADDDDKDYEGVSRISLNGKSKSRSSSAAFSETTTISPAAMSPSPLSFDLSSTTGLEQSQQYPPPRQGYGYSIQLTDDERELFQLLRQVYEETEMSTTLRVAGGWVRDKLLATPEFQVFHHNNYPGKRLTSKFKQSRSPQEQPSMGRQGTKVLLQDQFQGPVDIDIALDTMLGREFADHLNEYLQNRGKDTLSVGVVLKNPEKSKHLETATMQVGPFWVDFVNLRAEEYAEDSRIPDLMRIGTASEDAFRRDLTINSLFYNINTGQVEDWTGRGFADLRRGVVATPLTPLTTLLDDPLRVLRGIRFAARLRFTMDDELVASAMDDRVRLALAQKVSRERVGGEVDLMLRSPDPVGAMRLLVNLNLFSTVFPVSSCFPPAAQMNEEQVKKLFDRCHTLLSTTHDHLFDCKVTPPVWCQAKQMLTTNSLEETTLNKDEEARRLLWYASFLKPIHDYAERSKQDSAVTGKKANRSIMSRLLVDELKRPGRDAEAVEKIMKAASEMTKLIQSGCDLSATLILLSDVRVVEKHGSLHCSMRGRSIDSATEEDPVWEHAMEFRLLCSNVLQRVGPLWRAAMMLSLSEELASLNVGELEYAIEGDVIDESMEERRLGIIEQYDTFAAALQQIGLIGIWKSKPLIDGQEIKEILPFIPRGPAFRAVMDEQNEWMTTHPGADKDYLIEHLQIKFAEYVKPTADNKRKNESLKKQK